MEKNHYGDTILGVVTLDEIPEGRMICLTSHPQNKNYGSLTDVPGAKVPTSAAEAARARYCIAFAQDNRSTPLYQPHPQLNAALRYGFEQATNVPFSATVYLTHPGVMEGTVTIPSGVEANAFGEGVYTVPSGAYIYSAGLTTPGTQLEVEYTTVADRGKLKAYSAGSIVAEVVRFNSTDASLMFKILH